MIVKCIKCEQVKDLNKEELEEVGKFVEDRRLRAVHFLKYLSMDMRELCKDGRNHEWEFEDTFDRIVHEISARCDETEKVKIGKTNEISECGKIIKEYEDKRDAAIEKVEVCANTIMADKMLLKKVAYIDDPGLWLEEK